MFTITAMRNTPSNREVVPGGTTSREVLTRVPPATAEARADPSPGCA
jgi:hypothetical protein